MIIIKRRFQDVKKLFLLTISCITVVKIIAIGKTKNNINKIKEQHIIPHKYSYYFSTSALFNAY